MSLKVKWIFIGSCLFAILLIAGMLPSWIEGSHLQDLDPQNLKLNHDLSENEEVAQFAVSHDGSFAIYAVRDRSDESWSLFRTAVNGSGEPLRIDQNQIDGDRIVDFKISSDGNYVAVNMNQGLLSLTTDGLSYTWAERFDSRRARFFDIPEYDFTPDGLKLLFVVQITEYPPLFPVTTLKVANANGEGVTEIYNEQPSNLPVFTISSDSTSVLYGSQGPTGGTDIGPKLYVADLEQGDPILLDVNGAGVHYVAQFLPDGQSIVFQTNAKNEEGRVFGTGLYMISKDGTGLIDLNIDLEGQNVEVGNFQISQDGSRIVFYRGEDQWNFGLYSYSVESNELIELVPYKMNENVLWPNEFDISADSEKVVFRGNINNDGVDDAYYQIPISGGDPITLYSEDTDNEGFLEFKISPNSDYLVFSNYLWDVYPVGEADIILNSVGINGESEVVQIEKDLNRVDGFNSVPDFLFSSNGRRVIFRSGAGRIDDNGGELFSSPIDGSFPLQLSPFNENDVQLNMNEVVEINGQIFYRADQETSGQMELFTSITAGENQPPALASSGEAIFFAGLAKTFVVEVEDPNLSDGIAITAVDLPEWATFIDNGDGTASISGRPSAANLGQLSIGITATDEFDSFALQTLELSVVEIDTQLYFSIAGKSPD